MKNKLILIGIIILAALACVLIIWKLHTRSQPSFPVATQWSGYQDIRLGFSVGYPESDMTPPILATSEPNQADFSFIDKNQSAPAMWVEADGQYDTATNSPDIATWTNNDGNRNNVIGTTTIDGHEALMVGSSNNFIMTDHGRVFQFFVSDRIAPQDRKQIIQSFVFTGTILPLRTDLQGITPHFIDLGEHTQPLNSQEQKIKNDVSAILIPEPMDGVGVSLLAVGQRYVVAALLRPTDGGTPLEIIDSATGQIDSIPGLFQFIAHGSAVYLSAQDICTYTPDQSSCVSVPGAKLSGDEMYGDDETMGGYFQPQDETHTDTSITIAVLKLTPDPASCPDCKMLKKERDVTLPLPQ